MSELVQDLNKRWGLLKNERSSWWSHWKELSDVMLPRSGRYFIQDRNKGWKRNNTILDNTATKSIRVLGAGLMSGMTSPSRPWFKLAVEDTALQESQPSDLWLSQCTDIMLNVLAKSNFYRVAHAMYEELGVFGTAAAMMADDYQNIIHMHPFTIGEYAIGTDFKGEVNALFREFDKTISSVVAEFGIDNVSPTVKNQYQLGNYDAWVTIRHAMEPREQRDEAKLDGKNMAFTSIYWEQGRGDGHILRESGFHQFPNLVPRWATSGGDIYGNSPGMDCLGDVKQLQESQFRKSQAVAFQSNPPVQIPSSAKNREHELFPGGVTYYDPNGGANGGVKTAFEVQLNIQYLLADIQDIRQRIQSAFFSDIFMMIAESDGRMTATEVAARNQEKMLMIGPVLERLNNEMLRPTIETLFDRCMSAGIFPPPPEEMQGHELKVEYTSILAEAQKAVSMAGTDRFLQTLGVIAPLKPDVMDNINPDELVNVMSDKLGLDPRIIVPGKQVALIRQQRAAAAQKAQQAELMKNSSEIAQNVGGLSTEPGTVSGAMANRMGMQ